MSICHKCWNDAFDRSVNDRTKTQYEHYLDILNERKDNPCTQAEQIG